MRERCAPDFERLAIIRYEVDRAYGVNADAAQMMLTTIDELWEELRALREVAETSDLQIRSRLTWAGVDWGAPEHLRHAVSGLLDEHERLGKELAALCDQKKAPEKAAVPTPDPSNDPSKWREITTDTDRLSVPGGWLYRVTHLAENHDRQPGQNMYDTLVSVTYVPEGA